MTPSPSAVGGGGGSTRWCPTPEQLMILEEMYTGGVKTPTATQIQQITAHLSRYGKIEGKNVFYWFQNHKARDRQKLRRRLAKHLFMMSNSSTNFHHQYSISSSSSYNEYYNHHHHYRHQMNINQLSFIPPPPPPPRQSLLHKCCHSQAVLPQLPPPVHHDVFSSPMSSTIFNFNSVPYQGRLESTTTSSSNSPVMIKCNQQQLACNYDLCPLLSPPPPPPESALSVNSFGKYYYSKARVLLDEEGPPASTADQPIRTSNSSASYDVLKSGNEEDQNTMMFRDNPASMKIDTHNWMIITHHDSVPSSVKPLETLQLFPITPAKD